MSSVQDGPKDQTRNLEISGSHFVGRRMTMLRAIGVMAYYVYLLASRKDGAIYVGMTNDIVRRIYEHRIKAVPGFTSNTISRGLYGLKSTRIRFPPFPVRKN